MTPGLVLEAGLPARPGAVQAALIAGGLIRFQTRSSAALSCPTPAPFLRGSSFGCPFRPVGVGPWGVGGAGAPSGGVRGAGGRRPEVEHGALSAAPGLPLPERLQCGKPSPSRPEGSGTRCGSRRWCVGLSFRRRQLVFEKLGCVLHPLLAALLSYEVPECRWWHCADAAELSWRRYQDLPGTGLWRVSAVRSWPPSLTGTGSPGTQHGACLLAPLVWATGTRCVLLAAWPVKLSGRAEAPPSLHDLISGETSGGFLVGRCKDMN